MQAELVQHDVEGAEGTAMAPEHALHVEGSGGEALGDGGNLGRRHEQEHRAGVQEAADQPGAGDAVHLGARARDPDCASPGVVWREGIGAYEGTAGGGPGFEAAFEDLCPGAGVAEPGCGALAELQAALAGDDDVTVGIVGGPFGSGLPVAADGAGQQTGVCSEVVVRPDIEQDGGIGQPDQAGQLR